MKKILLILTISFFACDDIIEVPDITNSNMNILAPKNNTTLTDAAVIFSWDALEDAESYKIQIATPNFAEAQQIVADSLVIENTFSTTLNSGVYEWRLRAENSGYATAYVAQKFTLNASDPIDISNETITILTPENSASFSTTDTITFSWEALDGADSYTVQIVTPDFENPTETVKDDTITETSFSVSNLSSNTYKFRVKAENRGYETGYTEISFTVN